MENFWVECDEMRKKQLYAAALGIAILTGCGTTSNVMQLGPDTYRVTASRHNMAGGEPAAEEAALTTAATYCAQLGKQILVTNSSSSFARPLYSYSINFRCLKEGDADLQRPTYRSGADQVIEVR